MEPSERCELRQLQRSWIETEEQTQAVWICPKKNLKKKSWLEKTWFDHWYKKELRDRKRNEGEKLTCTIEEMTRKHRGTSGLYRAYIGSTPYQKVMKQKKKTEN